MPKKRPVAEKLEAYRAKRSADSTAEPFGGADAGEGRIGGGAFVVHKHAARRLHWDLRLEMDGVLKSWAVPQGVSLDPDDKRLAVMTEDHPLEYVDFEGIIPEGNYGAGAMIVWDRGRWIAREDVEHGFEQGKLLFELIGYKLRGVWTLVHTKRKGSKGNEWLLIKKPDGGSTLAGVSSPSEVSILSGLGVDDLALAGERASELRATVAELKAPKRRVDPASVKPMLAETRADAFDDPAWLFELKYDGYRMQACRRGDDVHLSFRSGTDATVAFPDLVRTLAALPVTDFILDGEVVVLEDDGKPNFQRLGKRARLSRSRDAEQAALDHPAVLYAFDVISVFGRDLRKVPLQQRKALLRDIAPQAGPVRYTEHVEGAGEALFAQVERVGLEGMMAKRATSTYRSGRHRDWLKIRVERTADCVIIGFTEPDGARAGFGALHLAAYVGDTLTYAGRVGTGFDDATLRSFRERFDAMLVDEPDVEGLVASGKVDHWIEPTLVCEVRYTEWTDDGRLRHPVFLHLRDDKQAAQCLMAPRDEAVVVEEPVEEEDEERPLELTNRDKVFWPEDGYTKGDLLDYHQAVAEWILPYLKDRPLTLTRYPDGIHGKSFFQRNVPSYVPSWVRTERHWSEDEGRDVELFVCDSLESLLYVVNLGTIPLHFWGSRTANIQHPDWCSLDLDPKGAPFEDVVTIAKAIKKLCDGIDVPTFVKTSGSTGLHVMIPLGGACTYEQCRMLGQLLARIVADDLPKIATIDRSMKKREGRVYIDFGQNGHGRVLAGPFSPRPLMGAPVSTPLRWREVTAKLDIHKFTIKTVPRRFRRLGEDPMQELLTMKPDLQKALAKLAEKL